MRLGYHAEVVLAGRRVNDGMGRYIARECIRRVVKLGRPNPMITILGITFKENVRDVRNSKVVDIIMELKTFGLGVQVYDPEADPDDVRREYGLSLIAQDALEPADAVVLAVSHKAFTDHGWPLVLSLLRGSSGVVLDVKGVLDRSKLPLGIDLWRM
jgi:UDP-N-acetyl-D-galactosamine dehydrogenase